MRARRGRKKNLVCWYPPFALTVKQSEMIKVVFSALMQGFEKWLVSKKFILVEFFLFFLNSWNTLFP